MKQIPLTQGQFAIVDDGDFDFISKSKWRLVNNGGANIYAGRRKVINGKGHSIYMHRQILKDLCAGFDVDHINGNGLDNRKENLRICTRQQNICNRKAPNSNSISGIRGVSFEKRTGKWVSRIKFNYKQIHIGTFLTIEEAEIAWKEKAKALFGDFY